MRPNDLEVLRLLEAVVLELGGEIPSAYGRAQAQFMFMLLETVASGWDEAVHHLYHDNRELAALLAQAQEALGRVPQDRPEVAALRQELPQVLARDTGEDLRLSTLEERHRQLMGALERFLCLCEDVAGEPAYEPLMPLRAQAYHHLRRAAVRGWTFWDALSFREYILKAREALSPQGQDLS